MYRNYAFQDDVYVKLEAGGMSPKILLQEVQGGAGIPVPGHSQEWRPLIPFPELWEWIFSFPSRSRILGMDLFHSLPVPEVADPQSGIIRDFPLIFLLFSLFASESTSRP